MEVEFLEILVPVSQKTSQFYKKNQPLTKGCPIQISTGGTCFQIFQSFGGRIAPKSANYWEKSKIPTCLVLKGSKTLYLLKPVFWTIYEGVSRKSFGSPKNRLSLYFYGQIFEKCSQNFVKRFPRRKFHTPLALGSVRIFLIPLLNRPENSWGSTNF